MKILPNGINVFNATPHIIRFWRADWAEPIEIEPDTIISAGASETITSPDIARASPDGIAGVTFFLVKFVGNADGESIITQAYQDGADLVVGSIIAAQAYPGLVFAMTPAPGYERVPPAQKRMNPDKFTTF